MLSPRATAPTLRTTAVLGLAMSHSIRAQQAPVVLAPAGSSGCPEGRAKIATLTECQRATMDLGLSGWKGHKFVEAWPGGCYYCDAIDPQCEGVWFNLAVGSANDRAAPICALPGWEDDVVSKAGRPLGLCLEGRARSPFFSASLTFQFWLGLSRRRRPPSTSAARSRAGRGASAAARRGARAVRRTGCTAEGAAGASSRILMRARRRAPT